MNRIEAEVHAHFAENRGGQGGTTVADTTPAPSTSTSPVAASEVAFANVNNVVPGSPADAAGMQAGDHIIRFGTVNWMNHDKLAKLAEVVQQNEGVTFFLSLNRFTSNRNSDLFRWLFDAVTAQVPQKPST